MAVVVSFFIWCVQSCSIYFRHVSPSNLLRCEKQEKQLARRPEVCTGWYFTSLASVISLHIRSMWETTVMHKQVSGRTVNFGPNFPDQSLLRNTPPISENFRFGMTKVYSEIPPHFGKLQIWDDQSLLRNTPPPFGKTSDLGWPKFTPKYPPPFRKTSDLGWPKLTPKYPPPRV